MRRLLLFLSLLTLALAVPHPAYCQSADTSDLFLSAYTANEQGEKLEGEGDSQKALAKYRYAASLLDQITHDDPAWNPIIINYRKKKVAENITRIEGAAIPPAPAPRSNGPAPMEGELPQKEEGATETAPPAGLPGDQPLLQSPSPAPGPATTGVSESQQVRAQIDELQSDLRDSQRKLKSVENEKAALAGKLDAALQQLDDSKVDVTELRGQLTQAQSAYQNAVTDHSQGNANISAPQKVLLARISQLENALKDAEADQDAANEQNADLSRRATKAKEATAEIEKEAKDNASKAAGAGKLATELDTANKQITSLTQNLDAANAHNKEIETKYADASKLAAQLDTANKRATTLARERDDANERADDLDGQLADAMKSVEKLSAAEKQIAALKAAGQQTGQQNSSLTDQLADAQKQITRLTGDRDAARKQLTTINGKLADTQKQIIAVKADRDQIAMQRDQALSDLAKARTAQKRVDELLAENTSLSSKLAADEKTIHDFKSGSPEKDKQIADLRKELSDTKATLTAAQQDRDNVRSSLNDLQQQYDSATAELADLKSKSNVSTTEKKTLTDENDLLRGIVMRELKEQARRDQARREVMTELSQMQIQSDTLLKQIDYLGQPVVQLSDKEKALFKDESLEIPDSDDSSMAISIAAPKQTASHTAQADAPAQDGTSNDGADAAGSPDPAGTPQQLASLSKEEAHAAWTSGSNEVATTGSAASTDNEEGTTAAGPVPAELKEDSHDAKDAFDRGEYRDAEKIYERMLTKAPNNVYILSNLGVVYFRNQKTRLAEESLKKAIAIAPEDVFSHCTLGIVYYKERQYDDAINELTRALTIDPKYAVAHNYLGITASQKGWQEAAKKELQAAIAYDPKYADAYFNLAVVYAMETPPDKESASKYYREAISLGAPPDPGLDQLIK
ncbi:MAG TPA: tetratricopeptide repeat protein [Chthoniobacteraceae bacterium]|jgi:predicted  nucleic acid-binding Zn-ribbon protein|nr:tetratricopeptide repeat protein [Chthoniobacteraceae bacterium]